MEQNHYISWLDERHYSENLASAHVLHRQYAFWPWWYTRIESSYDDSPEKVFNFDDHDWGILHFESESREEGAAVSLFDDIWCNCGCL